MDIYKVRRKDFEKVSFKKYLELNKPSYCDNCESNDNIQFHHIVPISLGGTNNLTNIATLCDKCHATIHDKKSIHNIELQKIGIQRAKEAGKHLGRPNAEYPKGWEEIYKQYKNKDITGVKAMEQLGLKRTTFYKLVKHINMK